MNVLKTIFVILEVVVLFNLLIFVHELGHFLAARWRGLKIERFAVWFGKPLWKTKINGVEYALGCIPAGGYVSLPQMAPMEALEGKNESKKEELPPISALDKIIVAFAGPLFSFGLALAFAVVVMIVGRPVNETESTTTIGYVVKDGPADKAGLKAGDKILEVDNMPVTKFAGMGPSVTWRVVRSEGPTIPVKVDRGGQILTFDPVPVKEPTKAWQRKSLRQIKIAPAQTAIVAAVSTNSPAAAAGLKAEDEILAVDGQNIYSLEALGDYFETHPDQKTFDLKIGRGNTNFLASVTPEKPVSPPDSPRKIGIAWDGDGRTFIVHPGAVQQVVDSVNAMVGTFGALFDRKSDIKPQHLGGALKIGEVYFRLFSLKEGWRLALWFSVIMNINLAILNMLPFPVLDGGHITLAILETLRRRPVSANVLGYVQTGCAVVLICYMLYIFFFDVQDLLPAGHTNEKPQQDIKFAPHPEPAR